LSFDLAIRKSKIGGRGVFAKRLFREYETIEVCPVLPLTPKEFEAVSKTTLGYYVYTWPGPRQSPKVDPSKYSGSAVVFGYGSMYNHSFDPNADWSINVKNRTMTFRALRDIQDGEEIFHNYNWYQEFFDAKGME
jgi:SET domain-containing protein